MLKLADTGGIFYGLSLTGTGMEAIHYMNFTYMLLPQNFQDSALTLAAGISGTLLIILVSASYSN